MSPRRPSHARPVRIARAALAALVLAGACTTVSAASPVRWPERPVRLVHGFTAGGNVDIQARIMGSGMAEETGQPVVIDMRPGAGGTIAAAIVAKSAPDGQTLFWMAAGHATAPGMYRKLPYDAVRDFTMLSVVSGAPYLVAVGPSSPVSSMEDLVKTARAQPGKLLFASAGVGTGMYLVAVRLQSQTGIQLTHVAYKGGTSTPMAVAQGEVPMMFGTFAEVRPHLDSGRLRVIGVTSPQRWDRMPSVPTFAESVAPGFSASGWQAIAAPGGMAAPLVSRIESVIHRVLKRADVQQRFAEIGSAVAITPATEAQRFLASEVATWTRVIRDAGIATQDF